MTGALRVVISDRAFITALAEDNLLTLRHEANLELKKRNDELRLKFVVPLKWPSWPQKCVCASGRLLYPAGSNYLFLAAFLAPAFFLAPPFFAADFFAPFLVAISHVLLFLVLVSRCLTSDHKILCLLVSCGLE